jgi:hypothetical protein
LIELYSTVADMKDQKEVIEKFNQQVNMSAEELEKWLESPESHKAGTGVGLESGKKIIEILRRNPNMDPDQYAEVSVSSLRLNLLLHILVAGRY